MILRMILLLKRNTKKEDHSFNQQGDVSITKKSQNRSQLTFVSVNIIKKSNTTAELTLHYSVTCIDDQVTDWCWTVACHVDYAKFMF